MRLFLAWATLLATLTAAVWAQEAETGRDTPWEGSVSLYTYLLAGAEDYLQPTVVAGRDWLHLEFRYNYEFIAAGSAWLGYRLHWGDAASVDFTPMVGAVLGSAEGVALGYHFGLDWRRISFYIEAEYVLDTGNEQDSFFYSWSELTLEPLDRLRVGLAAQRTRAWESALDVQRGLLLGYAAGRVDLAGYVFNPDRDDPTWVLALAVSF